MGSGARRAGQRRGCLEGAQEPSDSSIQLQHPRKGAWKTGRELRYQGGTCWGGAGGEGGWEAGGERRACRCEQDDDCPCLLQRSGVSAKEREEGGAGGGQSSITLDQHMPCLGPWGFPGTASACIF